MQCLFLVYLADITLYCLVFFVFCLHFIRTAINPLSWLIYHAFVFLTFSFILQAGVKGTLGRLVGIFENKERKHRTYVYVLIVTEVLEDWEDLVNIGRKREWFKIDDAIQVLQCHKPVQATYFEALQGSCLTSNGTPLVTTIGGDLSPTYSINQSSVSGIR
ncbi:Nudix hydrolase 3 [Ilyodon furcidens]|uniref:Nudix hydrolase 3 n=1 Tax=Ilyodon furcidens TaxID=33524 RepID=A0ABV0US44_9TELE